VIPRAKPPTCEDCHPRRRADLGCARGTVASRPVEYAAAPGIQFDRCPRAILRDQHPTDAAWTAQAQRWVLAAESGTLSHYLPPRPTDLVLDLIEHGQMVRGIMERAELDKPRDP